MRLTICEVEWCNQPCWRQHESDPNIPLFDPAKENQWRGCEDHVREWYQAGKFEFGNWLTFANQCTTYTRCYCGEKALPNDYLCELHREDK